MFKITRLCENLTSVVFENLISRDIISETPPLVFGKFTGLENRSYRKVKENLKLSETPTLNPEISAEGGLTNEFV